MLPATARGWGLVLDRARAFSRPLLGGGGCLALGLALVVVGCAPSASSAPLGLGPLAVAEQAAEQQDQAARRSASPARRTRRAEPVAARKPEPKPDEKAVAARAEGDDAARSPAAAEAASAEPVFEGLYAGEDVAVFALTGLPRNEQKDDKAKIRITKPDAGSVHITLINSEDGSDLCDLVARVEGNAAILESAQPCFSSDTEGTPEAELTSGRAVVEGDRLKMDAEGTLSVSLPDQDLEGELTYTFTGERQ